eukprot:s3009_g7.t1
MVWWTTASFVYKYFPTCQVRVTRFYHSCAGRGGGQRRAPDRSGQRRTSTASSRSQRALPELNGELQIAVGNAGPQRRAPDRSGQRRTSTASSRSQWALPDLNRELQMPVGTAGPQGQIECPNTLQKERQIECQIERQKECQKE